MGFGGLQLPLTKIMPGIDACTITVSAAIATTLTKEPDFRLDVLKMQSKRLG